MNHALVDSFLETPGGCHVAVPYSELVAEAFGDRCVEFRNPARDLLGQTWIDAALLHHPVTPPDPEHRFKRDESKPSAECQINESKRPVRDIHRSDDVQVFRNVNRQTIALRIGVRKFECFVRCSLARFQQT